MFNPADAIDMETKDYKHIFSFNIKDSAPPARKNLYAATSRYCRFCKRREGETTFRKAAHVIPQGFGNRYLTTSEQCDECNEKCGLLEGELMNMFNPLRGLAVSRTGSQGRIKFKTAKGSFVESGVGLKDRIIEIVPDDPDMELVTMPNGSVRLKVVVHNVNVFAAAKGLAVMAWHLMPYDSLMAMDHIRRWIMGELKTETKVSIFIQGLFGFSDIPTQLGFFRRLHSDGKLAPFVVAFNYEAVSLSFPIPDNSFRVTSPQVPLVKDESMFNKTIDLQAASSDRDGKVSITMHIGMGPGFVPG